MREYEFVYIVQPDVEPDRLEEIHARVVSAIEGGQGREETRSLFGRIESLVRLTGTDFRRMPDFAKYSAGLEALEKVVEQLGLFYAEELEVRTPPDPIDRP